MLINGEPQRSCTWPMSETAGADIMTIEGLGTPDNPHPIQQAFIDEQAVQCGFCISGPIPYGKAFIDKNPAASRDQIIQALNGILCRCSVHVRMVNALERYAQGVAK